MRSCTLTLAPTITAGIKPDDQSLIALFWQNIKSTGTLAPHVMVVHIGL